MRLIPTLTILQLANLKKAFTFPNKLGCAGSVEAAKQLEAAGVPILVGDDVSNPGTTPGATEHRELELLVEAGLTPTEALVGATSAAARVFRLDDRGTIAPGKRADLLLVNGDPMTDIKATRDIAACGKTACRRIAPASAPRLRRMDWSATSSRRNRRAGSGPVGSPGRIARWAENPLSS
jgi:hypothetical protein